MSKVLVCLSGGLDSAVVLDMMMDKYECEAVLFDYGQPHLIELDRAVSIATKKNVRYLKVSTPPIPKTNDVVFAGRNLVLASYAISIAAAMGFRAIAFGCNQSDWERFPDCRPDFWKAVNEASLAAYGISVMLPLLRMTKTEVVVEARRRAVNIEETWSCYDPSAGVPCGICLACVTRTDSGA